MMSREEEFRPDDLIAVLQAVNAIWPGAMLIRAVFPDTGHPTGDLCVIDHRDDDDYVGLIDLRGPVGLNSLGDVQRVRYVESAVETDNWSQDQAAMGIVDIDLTPP